MTYDDDAPISPLASATRVEAVFTAAYLGQPHQAMTLLADVATIDQEQMRTACRLLLALITAPAAEGATMTEAIHPIVTLCTATKLTTWQRYDKLYVLTKDGQRATPVGEIEAGAVVCGLGRIVEVRRSRVAS